MKRWLEEQGRWTSDLLLTLQETVSRYRLDLETGDGRRAIRKTYTCPFYTPGPRGCSIDRRHKPYGCLAFNPRVGGQTEGGDCASSQKDLAAREKEFPGEEEANRRVREEWRLNWETAPIPVALLSFASTIRAVQ